MSYSQFITNLCCVLPGARGCPGTTTMRVTRAPSPEIHAPCTPNTVSPPMMTRVFVPTCTLDGW